MQRHGWTLLFHEGVIVQLRKLQEAAARAEHNDPQGFESNANVKLFRALSQLILDVVPKDPARDDFRQGNTLGTAYRHWRRAKIGRRFRLFFRYDSKSRLIVYAWVNDENTLRSAGSKSDPYTVFERMLGRGHPPDDWDALIAATRSDWKASETSDA
ncbi:type II toxin-antitoxin system YhaV family toxin [Pseudomonas cremoricolorata]|uniref:Toxin YhaV n=1 Tax=Pseudomonas cremoricolorata TaxID=157783 RepID=A0A089Y959_9PSED|nr:type II toxin-antitoxin system YhaV family toxin [Pseudomonas cremoricolorata]AIR88383.1 toxin YhaV [Pseudomonas cremoricolorata]